VIAADAAAEQIHRWHAGYLIDPLREDLGEGL
jgi:hypothetical protein